MRLPKISQTLVENRVRQQSIYSEVCTGQRELQQTVLQKVIGNHL